MQCKAKAKSTGKRCGRSAATGYSVCPVHGAGTTKRVKAGTRKSPKLGGFKTGEHARPETIELKKQLDPEYEHCYNEILKNPQLATLDEMATPHLRQPVGDGLREACARGPKDPVERSGAGDLQGRANESRQAGRVREAAEAVRRCPEEGLL